MSNKKLVMRVSDVALHLIIRINSCKQLFIIILWCNADRGVCSGKVALILGVTTFFFMGAYLALPCVRLSHSAPLLLYLYIGVYFVLPSPSSMF